LTGFELIAKIGEGGMGQVWKARQLSLDRIVAIKLLSARYSKDPESVRQIFQEARTAAKLKYPGIVQVYDASEENGNYYFVMEFVDGCNVGEWIKRKKVLSVTDALVVAESVVAALDYAWRTAGLIHCDIKPENLMVDQDGTIKVADLGLSLTRDSDVSQPSDEIAGTPGYISPEQVQGERELDCRTDIYALGCCLYQMVTGRRPFMELSDHEAMEAQITSQVPDPRDIVPGIPLSVCCLIERMMVKDRDKRLNDWEAVLAELHRVQKGQLPSGAHPGPGESTMQRKISTKVVATTGETGALPKAPSKESPRMLVILLLLAGAALGLFLFSKKYEKNKAASLPAEPAIPEVSVPVTPPPGGAPTDATKSPGQGEEPIVPKPVVHHPVVKVQTLESTLAEIKRTADDFEADGAFEEGIRWLEQYSGKFARETASTRVSLAGALRRKIDMRQEEGDWQALMKDVTASLISAKYSSARQRVETALKDLKCRKHRDELVAVAGILGGLGTLNDKLLETFAADAGKVVKIRMARGEFTGQVVEVRDRMVVCKTPDATAQVNIRLEDLSMAERMARLLPLELPELYLVKGVTAVADKHYDEALENLGKTGPVLSPHLTRAVQEIMGKQRSDELASDSSCMAFTNVITRAGIEPAPFDLQRWRKEVDERQLTAEMARSVDRAMEVFLRTHSQSTFAANNTELILALQKACGLAIKPAPKPVPAEAQPDTAEQEYPSRRQSR